MSKYIYKPEELEKEVEKDYSSYSLGELQEIIGAIEDEPVKDKRSKTYKKYLKELNALYEIYNFKAGWKTYNTIKL